VAKFDLPQHSPGGGGLQRLHQGISVQRKVVYGGSYCEGRQHRGLRRYYAMYERLSFLHVHETYSGVTSCYDGASYVYKVSICGVLITVRKFAQKRGNKT